MTQKTEAQAPADGQTAERKDDATAKPEVKTEAPQADDAPVTRSELKTIVGEAVAAALAAQAATAAPQEAEPAKRSDGEAAGDKPAGEGEGNTLKAVEEVITRSVGGLADTMKQLGERLTAIEGATVVRSDSADGGESKPKDVFAGMFAANRK